MQDQDDEPPEPWGASAVREWTRDAAAETRAEIASIVNRLWAGNGAGLISAISLLATAARDGHRAPLWWLLCPGAFAVGLCALGASNILSIRRLTTRLRSLERTEGILDMEVQHVWSPSEAIGILWSDWRARLSILAALSLVVGLATGLLAVFIATRR